MISCSVLFEKQQSTYAVQMPTLHRLSVFRDDLVFVVYLYQRWIYRVDKRRANEFG